MDGFVHFFVTGAFVCFLSIHGASCALDTMYYKINSIHHINVDPHMAKTVLRITADFYVQFYKNYNDTYLYTLQNTQFFIQKEDGESLNLNQCSSMTDTNISLLKPFVGWYDDGLLQYITVHRDESDLSVNLKLYLSNIQQCRESILYETTTRATIYEPIYSGGSCPANYIIDKRNQSNSVLIQINRNYDMRLCRNLNNTRLSYLQNICKNDTQDQLKWDRKSRMIVTKTEAGLLLNFEKYTENMTFSPWIDGPDSNKINVQSLTNVTLVDGNSIISPFLDINTANIPKYLYRDVDSSVFKENRNKILPITYRALACQSTTQNLLMELYEKAINCWKKF